MSEVIIIKPTKSNSVLKCAAYCRVSTNSENQTLSFDGQKQHYTAFFNAKTNEKLVEIYADRDTGTSMENRDEFQRMLADCRKGKIDRIYAKSVSRFARNLKENLTVIRELKSLDISVYFEKENIDTAITTTEINLSLYSLFAEQESKSISQNIRWGAEKRMKNGTYVNGSAPFGYDYDKSTKTYKINPEKAEIVKEIFRLYLSGMSMNKISDVIEFYEQKIGLILKNPAYCGTAIFQKTYTENFKLKTNKGNKPQYIKQNYFPIIISEEDFVKAQELRKSKTRNNDAKNKFTGGNEFSGIIKCGQCGATYIISKNNVHCYNRYTNYKKCYNILLDKRKLQSTFIRFFNELNQTNILQIELKKLEKNQNTRYKSNSEIAGKKFEIDKLMKQAHIYTQLKNQNALDDALFIEQTNAINMRIYELQSKLKKANQHDDEQTQIDEIKEFIAILNATEMTEFDIEIFKKTIKNVTVQPSGELIFKTLGGLEFTRNIEEN